MSLALRNKLLSLEERVESLETALNLLLRSENRANIEELPVIVKLKNDIQGLKMRAGKQ